jgi:hypothetical protein
MASYLNKDNYKAWTVSLADYNEAWPTEQKVKFFLSFGLLSPSGHNSQPWYFSDLKDNTVKIHIDSNRSLTQSDPSQKQLLLSLGCLVETISQAALACNFETHAQVSFSSEQMPEVFLTFIPTTEKSNDRLAQYISSRQTDRGEYYLENPLPTDFVNKSKELISSDTVLILMQDRLADLADLAVSAQIQTMESKLFRQELSEFIRSSYTKSKTGMTGFALEIPAIVSLFASKVIQKVNLSEKSKNKDLDLLKNNTPAFLTLGRTTSSRMEWFKAGRDFLKVWLLAESEGLKISPWAAPIQVKNSQKELQKICSPNSEFVPMVFCRIGYPKKYNKKHTPRFQLSDLLR